MAFGRAVPVDGVAFEGSGVVKASLVEFDDFLIWILISIDIKEDTKQHPQQTRSHIRADPHRFLPCFTAHFYYINLI